MIRIADIETQFGEVTILRTKRSGTLIYSQGGSFQSEADSAGVSLAGYIHAIFGLIVQTSARRLLVIGCGGGTLANMLVRTGKQITIVDVNPVAFEVAREYFGLSSSIACETADGLQFLLSTTRQYDAIVLDAFHGSWIPTHLRSASFFRIAKARMTTRGTLLANVHVNSDFDNTAVRMAEAMADIWSCVRLLDTPGKRSRNTILMAGAVEQLKKPDLQLPPECSADEIAAELGAMELRGWGS